MPVRRRLQRRDTAAGVETIAFVCFDGCDHFFASEPRFKTRAEAERAWPQYRRPAWDDTQYGRVPQAATEYDGITAGGAEQLWLTWRHERFDPAPIAAALTEDRESLETFRRESPKAARPIEKHLALWAAWLDALDQALIQRTAMQDFREYTGQHCPTPPGETYGERLATGRTNDTSMTEADEDEDAPGEG